MNFTVKVTRVPGLTQEVTLDGPTTAEEVMELASQEMGRSDELRFNGSPIATDYEIGGAGVLTITRTIKSN